MSFLSKFEFLSDLDLLHLDLSNLNVVSNLLLTAGAVVVVITMIYLDVLDRRGGPGRHSDTFSKILVAIMILLMVATVVTRMVYCYQNEPEKLGHQDNAYYIIGFIPLPAMGFWLILAGRPLLMLMTGGIIGAVVTGISHLIFPTQNDKNHRAQEKRKHERERTAELEKKKQRQKKLDEEGEYEVVSKTVHLRMVDDKGDSILTREEAEKLQKKLERQNVNTEIRLRKKKRL